MMDEKVFFVLTFVLLAVMTVDAMLTIYNLNKGSHEANPVMRFFYGWRGDVGVYFFLLLKMMFVLLLENEFLMTDNLKHKNFIAYLFSVFLALHLFLGIGSNIIRILNSYFRGLL